MANKITVTVKGRRRTFPSLKAAAKAARVPYITFWQRLHTLGKPPSVAFSKPVRAYRKAA